MKNKNNNQNKILRTLKIPRILRTRTAATTKIAAETTIMKPKTATKHKRSFTPTEKAKALTDMKSDTDVNGSYTGAPKNPREIPVQDADDL